MTAQAKALYDFINFTIEHELVEELDSLANYEKINVSALKDLIRSADALNLAGKRRS